MMIGKRFDAYREVSTEHVTQRLSAHQYVPALKVKLGRFFPEHTVHKVLERTFTRRTVNVSRGGLHM